ncbi:class I SAM-dependent methyltransferase [Chloroflexota bacterium]
MQVAEIDWLELWRALIIANPHTPDSEPIKRYKTHAYQRRKSPDPLLDFILQSIDSGTTVIDVGAGNGRWTIPVAMSARIVIAIEPDGDMIEVLRKNVKTARGNIQIVQSSWEEARVEIHDVVVCAHAMYSTPDFATFVRKMEQQARQTCYMAIRLPPVDGVLGELTSAIYGHPYDSANAVIAYNALYSMGIYANMLVENGINYWVNDTFEEAFIRAKRHLCLQSNSTYDGLIRDTLHKRLILSNNRYVWPDDMRSALLWWNPRATSKQ